MFCFAAKPIVNGIEKDLGSDAAVVRVHTSGEIGKQLAKRLDVKGQPTLVILDGNGKEVYRHKGLPRRKTVVERVRRL